MIVDMFRILEVMTRHAPEIFVDKNQIHSIRLINYIMFVLHSVFVGKLDTYIEYFAGRVMHRGDTLAQLLAPLVAILKNLYEAASTLGEKDNARYDNLVDILRKTDSFDPQLFHRLRSVVVNELPPRDRREAEVLEVFGKQMLEEVDMLVESKVVRRVSRDEAELEQEMMEGQADEDKLCNICYF